MLSFVINLCFTYEKTAKLFSKGILHSSLSVWWFYFPAQGIFVFILTILLCVWGGLVCVLRPPSTFPQAHILTQRLTVLWWYAESRIYSHLGSESWSSFLSGTFLNVIPLCSFLCPILFRVHLLRLLLLLVLFPPPLGYSESSPHNECNSKSQSLFPWILQ